MQDESRKDEHGQNPLSVVDRQAERKAQTRKALLEAARSLIFERPEGGHEAISISDITHRAGVSTGTFYNYFDTKQDVFLAVIDDYRTCFRDCLDQVRAGISDPAMTIAVSLNYYFREASTNEAWNTFVARCGLDGEHLLHQDPDQCLADVKRGATAGRFKSEDPAFTQNLVTGMVQHTLRQIAAGRLDGDAAKATTAHVLRMLGLPDLVARALADGRLPPIAAPRRTPITEAPANVTPLVVLSGETARNS